MQQYPMDCGVHLRVVQLLPTPEYRLRVAAGNQRSHDPGDDDPSDDSPSSQNRPLLNTLLDGLINDRTLARFWYELAAGVCSLQPCLFGLQDLS
jgi:hypothetical protein